MKFGGLTWLQLTHVSEKEIPQVILLFDSVAYGPSCEYLQCYEHTLIVSVH
jgi:hypothetical protein